MSTNNSSLLRGALYANSVFCFTSGLAFTLFSKPISTFLGLSAVWIILVLGVVLCLYGIEVFILARRGSVNEGLAKFAIGADIAWVIGSAILIFTNLVAFTTPGKWAIAAIADIVLVFAIGQYMGLRKLQNQ